MERSSTMSVAEVTENSAETRAPNGRCQLPDRRPYRAI
jgi:hypothetical protein